MMAVLLTIVSVASAMAVSKKEQKALMEQVVSAIERGEKAVNSEVPAFLLDDMAASLYCIEILCKTDEQYNEDIARANKVIDEAQWVLDNCFMPEGEVEVQLRKKGYTIDRMLYCRHWAEEFTQRIHPRYDIMVSHCELQLKRRREALERPMPEGELVKFEYREYGSSRPTEVLVTLTRVNSDKWMLNCTEESKDVADRIRQVHKEVDKEVAVKIRQMAEQSKLYQCLYYYEEQPSFEKAPHLLGGPPSWSFRCVFEGGTISSESECMPVPEGCTEIVNYLRKIQEDVCKNQQEQN